HWTSANRDERVFGAPDAFDPEGNAAENLVYGTGRHVCPGRPLATLELVALMQELLAVAEVRPAPTAGARETAPVGGWAHAPVVRAPRRWGSLRLGATGRRRALRGRSGLSRGPRRSAPRARRSPRGPPGGAPPRRRPRDARAPSRAPTPTGTRRRRTRRHRRGAAPPRRADRRAVGRRARRTPRRRGAAGPSRGRSRAIASRPPAVGSRSRRPGSARPSPGSTRTPPATSPPARGLAPPRPGVRRSRSPAGRRSARHRPGGGSPHASACAA